MALLAYALTTLANVKALLGITDTVSDDILENYIDAATEAIENYCKRRFTSTTYTDEVYDGTGTKYLNLKHYPVTAITVREKLISDYGSDSWDDLQDEWFQFQENGRVIYNIGFDEGFSNYRFTYVAGYVVIPDDVRDACEKIAVTWFQAKKKAGGIQSERLGEYSVTFGDFKNQIKDLGLDEILDAYRTPEV